MKTKLYKDFNQFSPNKQGFVYNENAVYQSIINIISVIKGEILFNFDFSMNLEEFLFELDSDTPSSETLLGSLVSAIEGFDNRITININQSEVVLKPDDNKLSISLVFGIQGFDGQNFEIQEDIEV